MCKRSNDLSPPAYVFAVRLDSSNFANPMGEGGRIKINKYKNKTKKTKNKGKRDELTDKACLIRSFIVFDYLYRV